MFKELFSKLNKNNKISNEQKSIPTAVPKKNSMFSEEELAAEKEESEAIQKMVDAADPEMKQKIEERIRAEFKAQFNVDSSNKTAAFAQLESIKDYLMADVLFTRNKVKERIERQTIYKVFEEMLISIGSSLDEFYDWAVNEDDDELEDEEETHKGLHH